MAIPSWPAGLPHMPLRSSFRRLELHRPLARFETEDGPDIVRVRANTRIERLQYVLHFTHAQYLIFRDFVETTLVQGSQRFSMDVPVDGWACENRPVYIEGGAVTIEPLGTGWAASFVLSVMPAV